MCLEEGGFELHTLGSQHPDWVGGILEKFYSEVDGNILGARRMVVLQGELTYSQWFPPHTTQETKLD